MKPADRMPTPYGNLYTRFRKVLGINSEIQVANSFDYNRYWQNCFVVAIDTSLWGTDPNGVSPVDENMTGINLRFNY